MQIVGWCILIISARTLNCYPMREFRGANRGGGRKKSKNLHSKITENMPRTPQANWQTRIFLNPNPPPRGN